MTAKDLALQDIMRCRMAGADEVRIMFLHAEIIEDIITWAKETHDNGENWSKLSTEDLYRKFKEASA